MAGSSLAQKAGSGGGGICVGTWISYVFESCLSLPPRVTLRRDLLCPVYLSCDFWVIM